MLKSNWLAVWVILAAGFAAGAHMGKVPPALPAMRADLGIGLIESGFVHSMMYTIGGAVGMFAGTAADRFGQKRFALIGLGMMVAGGILGTLAPTYAVLLGSRFLEGIGFILFTVSAASLIAAAAQQKDHATAYSLWSTYMPTGGALVMLGAPLALATSGWRGLWAALAAYTALCAWLLARYVPAPTFGGGVGSLRLLTDSLTRPGILALCLVFICYVGQWTSLMTWLPTFLVEERGASQATASWFTAAFVAANIPGTLLGGWLLKRGMARSAVMSIGAISMGVMALGILAAGIPDAFRFACILAFSLLGGVIPGTVFSATTVHAKSRQHIATTNGMIMQSSHLSQFLVPILVAWVASRFGGWSASLNTMLVLAGVGVAAALAVGRFERRLQAQAR
jgi:predicted MFS family arabinose efflux permease